MRTWLAARRRSAAVPWSPRAAVAFLPGAVAFFWAATRAPFLSPDSLEAVATGRCLLGLDGPALCAAVERTMWPPGFPLVAGALSALVEPRLAVLLVSLAAGALLTVPVARLAAALGGEAAGLAAAVLLLAMHGLGFHALAGDARTLALLLACTAWAGALGLARPPPAEAARDRAPRTLPIGTAGGHPHTLRALATGASAGLAAWCRPEALGTAVLLLAWVALRRRAAFPRVAIGFFATASVWWVWLSAALGRPAVLARGWEMSVLEWQRVVPLPWLFQLFGLGAGGSPIRDAVRTEVSFASVPLPLLLDGLAKTAAILGKVVPLAAWPLAVVGLAAAVRVRSERGALVAPAALIATAAAAGSLPQAQAHALPEANLLGVLVGVAILAGVGAARLARRLDGGAGLAAALLAFAVWLGDLALFPDRASPVGAARPVAVRAAAWIAAHTPPHARVTATFETGSARLTGRAIERFPSPWELQRWDVTTRPDYLLVSAFDVPWVLGALDHLAKTGELDTVSYVRSDDDWIVVLRAVDRPGGEGPVRGAEADASGGPGR